jgi:uncharacterized protein YeaO (DUF488 family)
MAAKLQVKRIYEPASPDDGARLLVDRIWPRGVTKDAAALTLWFKDIAPSDSLRKWFGHDPERYTEFGRRYRKELDVNGEAVAHLRAFLKEGRVTLLYAAHDAVHNQALVLEDYIKKHATPRKSSGAKTPAAESARAKPARSKKS